MFPQIPSRVRSSRFLSSLFKSRLQVPSLLLLPSPMAVPGPYSGVSTLAFVARASAFTFGLVYGSVKLSYLQVCVPSTIYFLPPFLEFYLTSFFRKMYFTSLGCARSAAMFHESVSDM
ncbi:F-type H+-transporting ATPase subunit e [Apostasia shenzhenica]|uniref:F-type H+-transporting ATPase subunit e n=1 Tax=Apostasia shenzhenica TaxID=1088818 RepID=A0A2H9ZWM2_9ASPA|nr:F-type H+-transporting ATPase subunit e [Apostasia shenzhenica]